MIISNKLILYYHPLNRYSFNALAGAMDMDPNLADTPATLVTNADALRTVAEAGVTQRNRVIVALSVMTCQFGEMRRLIRQLRSDCGRRILIMAGGPHITACPEQALEAGIDIAFCGEAERTFTDTLRRIAEGQEFHGIQTSANPVDLDSFMSISPKRGMFGPIEITRGCAFACSYCQTSRIFGTNLRHRSVDSILRQAAGLRSGNRKVVRLLSPNAFSYGSPDGRQLNMNALQELLAALRKEVSNKGKILFAHFPSEARPEHITPETLDLLKEFADNDEIVIGAQSGSGRTLEACHRSHTVEDALAAVSLARRYGYKVIIDFIYGLPGESEQDMRQTLKVMEDVVRMGARIHPHIFAPLPQTPFAKEPPGRLSPEIMETLRQLQQRRGIYSTKAPSPLEISKDS